MGPSLSQLWGTLVTAKRRCHYCERVYAEGDGDASAALARHLTEDCRAVPESIRQSYDRGCAFGTCRT